MYTLEYFNNYKTEYILSDDTLDSIKKLRNSINVTEKRNDRKMRKSVSDENWEMLRNFKATKIVNNEEAEKPSNDLRNILNKLSKGNIDENVEKLKTILTSQSNEELKKSVQLILQISCSNNFYSELYSKMMKEIIKITTIIKDELFYLIQNYINNLKNIEYVDPNVNYDDFCKYNKQNDLQKSKLLFFMNLNKEEIIQSNELDNIEKAIFDSIEKNIIIENKKNEVEELIENLFVYYSNVSNQINKEECMLKIKNIYADKERALSLSSRGKFRCMDIIDIIDKL
tara:strand:- start:750 stop:1604 length:855 start_codon:yes stop_codon:yes gene_type:complete